MKKIIRHVIAAIVVASIVFTMIPSNIFGSEQKTVDFQEPTKPKRSTVSIVQSSKKDAFKITQSDIDKMVADAVKKAGGLKGLTDGMSVTLKVNLVNYMTYIWAPTQLKLPTQTANGVTTDYRVVRAVAKLVREVNPTGKIYVVEGSAVSTKEAYKQLGYTKENLPEVDEFIELEKVSGKMAEYESDKLVKVNYPGNRYGNKEIYYNKDYYYDVDYFITIPVLKNHWDAAVTGGIKNMSIGGTPANIYGQASGGYGRGWNNGKGINHDDPELRKWIHDYYICRPADFCVIDGIQGSQGGPTPMNNAGLGTDVKNYYMNMRCIIAGSDSVATDTIEALVTEWDPQSARYLDYLDESGLGNTDVRKIDVVGKSVQSVRKPFAGEMGRNTDLPTSNGKVKSGKMIPTTKPSITIKSAKIAKSRKKVNLKLTTKSSTKIMKIYLDGKLTQTITSKSKFAKPTISTSKLKKGKHTIKVKVYNRYLSEKTVSKTIK